MDALQAHPWFWGIVVFLYFTFKNFILSKVFKNTKISTHPAISLTMAVLALYANSQLVRSYDRYLNMSYVKGAIRLPHFSLLFVLSDLLATVTVIVIFIIKLGPKFSRLKLMHAIFNFASLLFIYVIFTTLISTLWLKETQKNVNWNYMCFKNQIAIDLATFYFKNQHLPEKLEEFTSFKINPINNSPLILTPGSTLSIAVTDEKGNKIMEGYKDLMGLKMYSENPEDFFATYRIFGENACSDLLKIPLEYNIEPSWKRRE